jgi:hypothetical protein
MEGMGYLSRTQILTGLKCSSTQPCLPRWTALSSKR